MNYNAYLSKYKYTVALSRFFLCMYICGVITHAHEDHRLTQMKSSEVLDHPPPYILRQALLHDIRASSSAYN